MPPLVDWWNPLILGRKVNLQFSGWYATISCQGWNRHWYNFRYRFSLIWLLLPTVDHWILKGNRNRNPPWIYGQTLVSGWFVSLNLNPGFPYKTDGKDVSFPVDFPTKTRWDLPWGSQSWTWEGRTAGCARGCWATPRRPCCSTRWGPRTWSKDGSMFHGHVTGGWSRK